MKKWKALIVFIWMFAVTCLASCEKKSVTLTYKANEGIFLNGNDVISYTHKEGDTIQIITEIPTRFNHVFSGWYFEDGCKLESSEITLEKHTILYAKWEERVYNVTFKLEEGTFSDGTSEKIVQYKLNDKLDLIENPMCTDKMFNGWYDESGNLVKEGTLITKDVEFVAQFKTPGNEASVTYVLNGGTMEHPLNDKYYENIIYYLPVPTYAGFTFLGWYDNPDFFNESIIIQPDNATGDKTYYARWQIEDLNVINNIIDEFVPDYTTESFELPTKYNGATIEWVSDTPSVISNRGIVSLSHRKETVTIVANITYLEEEYNFLKEVTVPAITFKKVKNPIAGYFYTSSIAIKTDLVLDNLNIAYYAFANISENGVVHIEGKNYFDKFVSDSVELRKQGLQIVLSVAGGASNFASACSGEGYKDVGDQIIEIVKMYNFDGVDIDWEFPRNNTDKNNMLLLANYLRLEMTKLEDGTGSSYLLTAAIPSHTSYAMFDLKNLNSCLDYVNMMSYDMHSQYRATHNCPLFSAYNDNSAGNGIDRGISYFTNAGLDKDKIIIGAAFYGKAFKVTGIVNMSNKYPALGVSATPCYLQLASSYTVFYSYLVQNILPNSDYVRYWDSDACLPYLYNEKTKVFITYEDKESIRLKTEYAYEQGVGIMFWEYSYDYNNELTHTICETMQNLKNS